jgi:hypothetical protein
MPWDINQIEKANAASCQKLRGSLSQRRAAAKLDSTIKTPRLNCSRSERKGPGGFVPRVESTSTCASNRPMPAAMILRGCDKSASLSAAYRVMSIHRQITIVSYRGLSAALDSALRCSVLSPLWQQSCGPDWTFSNSRFAVTNERTSDQAQRREVIFNA